jgi:SAM-dependent methyltransferase
MKRNVKQHLKSCFPIIAYYLALRRTGNKARLRKRLFQQLIRESTDKKCLQVGVHRGKRGPNWVSVDLYDYSDYVDYHYDIHNLKFEDQTFDVAVCNAVLEHVEDPIKAISELRRVLKKGGLIWVEVPFNFPYHESPNDYWRVSVPGIRMWMKDFTEIESGLFLLRVSPAANAVFYYGRK